MAERTVRAAVERAASAAPGLPLVAGGKSFGGRMTSRAQVREPLPEVEGLVFLGFPLHAPGKPSERRAAHLAEVAIPMLFLQGTRDSLADLGLMKRVVHRLGQRATLSVVDGGDHSFKMSKKLGGQDRDILQELTQTIVDWATGVV
ncbi:MAG: alpha/beta family hydrolase [Gemmatimonadales bacterium]